MQYRLDTIFVDYFDVWGIPCILLLTEITILQRLSRLEEEARSQIETRKRKFFAEILNAVREFQVNIQASVKRRKQRNDGVQVCSFLLDVDCFFQTI